jgi:ribosome maturation factor RimP
MSQQRGRRGGGSRDAGQPAPKTRAPGPTVPGPIAAEHRARVRAVVEHVATEAGYDLEDLAIQRVGRRYLVRIAVDRDAGVNLDAIAELSRKISASLDETEAGGEELIAGEYELEVGSPGVDRPLVEERHWRRNIGRSVQVRAGGQQVTARISDVDAAGVVLDAARFAFADLGPGRVQVELKRLEADLEASDLEDAIEDDGEDEE